MDWISLCMGCVWTEPCPDRADEADYPDKLSHHQTETDWIQGQTDCWKVLLPEKSFFCPEEPTVQKSCIFVVFAITDLALL